MKLCKTCNQLKNEDDFKQIKQCNDCVLIKKRLNDKRYYERNKNKSFQKTKTYRENNKEKVTELNREYYIKNKERINSNRQERIKNDPVFALRISIKNSIRDSFKSINENKTSLGKEILGCSYEFFKEYIESKFESWMTWENKGLYNGQPNYGWDIDHIIPMATAKTKEDVIRLNHYTNLQPLCGYTNRVVKRDNF